jgi:glycosyltransferase involved in cell wall biosynthesis
VRVALVCGRFRPDRDGVADYVASLAEALPDAGVEAVVAAAGPRRELEAQGAVSLATRWDVAGAAAAARALRRLEVDLVHVQFAPSAYGYSPSVGLLPVGLGTVPLVTTLHEYGWWSWPSRVPPPAWDLLEQRAPWDRETLTLAPSSARLVVTNPVHAEVVRARLRREPEVIPIGPNVEASLSGVLPGDEREEVRAAVRQDLGLPDNAPLLVFFGFVHPVKGLRHLLDALPTLLQRHPGTHLVIAGGVESLALVGEEAAAFETELREQVTRLGLGRAVTMTGWLPSSRVSRLLAAGDVGVFPYTHGVTGKAGAVLAAQAHRLPVVVTRADPPDPLFVDGETALVVEPRDSATLLEAVDRLLSDPGLAGRVAAAGRELAAERSWDQVAAAHARLYAEVLAESREREAGSAAR